MKKIASLRANDLPVGLTPVPDAKPIYVSKEAQERMRKALNVKDNWKKVTSNMYYRKVKDKKDPYVEVCKTSANSWEYFYLLNSNDDFPKKSEKTYATAEEAIVAAEAFCANPTYHKVVPADHLTK